MENTASGAVIRVLGLDPAAAGPTGYGVLEGDARRCRLLDWGALRVPPKRRGNGCGSGVLSEVHALMDRLIAKHKPDVVAVESVFAALNVRTALRLAEVRGVVLLTAEQHGLPVHSYSPREVKASVAGYGHATKEQIQRMVRAILAMPETPQPPDAADALAVALCHLQMDGVTRRFGMITTSGRPLPQRDSQGKARSATIGL
ncbi:MAG TPA: crossover junction endodeoxyribonuclease RuvC [Methylomirabilota bacterium]|nr:crossover junction endodeoxyribonuclease RuvC [Methylomirabilota bacterium]